MKSNKTIFQSRTILMGSFCRETSTKVAFSPIFMAFDLFMVFKQCNYKSANRLRSFRFSFMIQFSIFTIFSRNRLENTCCNTVRNTSGLKEVNGVWYFEKTGSIGLVYITGQIDKQIATIYVDLKRTLIQKMYRTKCQNSNVKPSKVISFSSFDYRFNQT